MKIWQRYLFFSLAKAFLFFLVTLFLLYVLVDLSIHGVKFLFLGKSTLLSVLSYYFFSFLEHFELFVGLCLLLSALLTLLTLNQRGELTVLEMAGLSKKRILSPFFLLGLLLTLFSFAKSEWLLPFTKENTSAFKRAHESVEAKKPLQTLAFDDNSELVYQKFDNIEKKLFDTYWIRSEKEIWHIQELSFGSAIPTGFEVEKFGFNEEGLLEQKESFANYTFHEMLWDPEKKLDALLSPETLSLSSLYKGAALRGKQEEFLSYFHYRIASPLLFFFILMGVSIVSFSFSRMKKSFLITVFSLLLFITYLTLLDSMLILAETAVLTPWIAIWSPFFLLSLFLLPTFIRMR